MPGAMTARHERFDSSVAGSTQTRAPRGLRTAWTMTSPGSLAKTTRKPPDPKDLGPGGIYHEKQA